jgi:hypothetical protein
METRLEFSNPHNEETKWAYAPFLSAAQNAAGPLVCRCLTCNLISLHAAIGLHTRSGQPGKLQCPGILQLTNLPVLEPSFVSGT